jgi:hypothetical protein
MSTRGACPTPATSWDETSCPPVAPGSCEAPGCAPQSRRAAASLLETVVPHRSRGAAVSLLEMIVAHISCQAVARLQVVPHRSLLATGSLVAASLLPPESTWVARLQAATPRTRPATVTANPATSRSRGPSRRSRTRTLRPGPLGWSQEGRRWSRKLEEIVILNHVS